MFNLFKKSGTENVFDKVVKSLLTDNSPLERWLSGLKKENRTELYFFHLVYGWLFMIDHGLISDNNKDKDDNPLRYINSFHSILNHKNSKSNNSNYYILSIEKFLEIFLDRFLKHRTELTLVRKHQLNAVPYFPNYFYSRIMIYPLELNEINMEKKYFNEEWGHFELSDMYKHHVNFIENNLNKDFKFLK